MPPKLNVPTTTTTDGLCLADHGQEHPAAVHLLDEVTAGEMARIFGALADPTRVRIVGLLAQSELCVGDIHRLLDMSQPAVSHHLRVLRDLRLVRARREGRHVYYTLDDDHVAELFRQGLDHARHG